MSPACTFLIWQALPVEKGIKYGANLWIHQYDFRTPSSRACEFTFKNTYDPEAQLPHYMDARRAAGLPDRLPRTMQGMPQARDLKTA